MVVKKCYLYPSFRGSRLQQFYCRSGKANLISNLIEILGNERGQLTNVFHLTKNANALSLPKVGLTFSNYV